MVVSRMQLQDNPRTRSENHQAGQGYLRILFATNDSCCNSIIRIASKQRWLRPDTSVLSKYSVISFNYESGSQNTEPNPGGDREELAASIDCACCSRVGVCVFLLDKSGCVHTPFAYATSHRWNRSHFKNVGCVGAVCGFVAGFASCITDARSEGQSVVHRIGHLCCGRCGGELPQHVQNSCAAGAVWTVAGCNGNAGFSRGAFVVRMERRRA